MSMNRQTLIIVGLVGAILVLLWFHGCEARNFKEEINLLNAVNDTLVKKRDKKDSSQTAKISLLTASNVKMLLNLSNRDETIQQLQYVIKEYKGKLKDGGSVTVFTTQTTFTSTAASTIIPNGKDSCGTVTAKKDNKWIKWRVLANRDSVHLDLSVKNAYHVVIGTDRSGFLGLKRKPFVEVKSLNPFTDIQTMRAAEVKDTRKRWLTVGAQVGFGFTLKGIGPYAGIGLNATFP